MVTGTTKRKSASSKRQNILDLGKQAINKLKWLEWSRTTTGPSTGMGLNNGPEWSCCPDCGGVKPSDLEGWNKSFQHLAGHRPKCGLNNILKAAKKLK